MNQLKFMVGLLPALLLAACSSQSFQAKDGVIVKAKLFQGGQVVRLDTDIPGMEDMLEIQLVPAGEATADMAGSYYGEYSDDGSLEFSGPGKGIPPGQYRLVVTQADLAASADDPEVASKDQFKGQFTRNTSPFVFDVPADKVGGEHDLGTIDLDQPPAG